MQLLDSEEGDVVSRRIDHGDLRAGNVEVELAGENPIPAERLGGAAV